MLFSVEQAFVGREEIRAPLKMPAGEAKTELDDTKSCYQLIITVTISEKINVFCFVKEHLNQMSKIRENITGGDTD